MEAKITSYITIFFLCFGFVAFSQTPYLVKDINPGVTASYISNLTNVNNTLFFAAFDPTHGLELWKSDGTTAGTVLVKDINVGVNNSVPARLVNANGTLFFRADDGVNGPELWKSDGTTAGTVMVKNINPSTIDNNSNQLAEILSIGNEVYFMADDGVHGFELWKSNGTEAGTVMVKDINPGSESAYMGWLRNINGILFFRAYDGVNGDELWKSNGTTSGTLMVKNINPGMGSGLGSYPFITNVNGMVYFVGNDGVHERELWKSDGTEAGTVMVKDIYPGDNGFSANSSVPFYLSNVNGTLFFEATDGIHGHELWKSDGTEAGTLMIKDIKEGISSSYPNALSNCNGILYFQAIDATGIRDVWKSDGTESGTLLLKDPSLAVIYSEPAEFTYLNGYVYFTATNYTIGQELFRTDGTPNGTIGYNIRYLTESSSPANLTIVGNTLYFTANNGPNGTELWALATEALSIDEPIHGSNTISIYPNPTRDIMNIHNPSNINIDKIVVTDMTGKKVMERKNAANDLNLSSLQNGIYVVSIHSNEKTFVSKIIKI